MNSYCYGEINIYMNMKEISTSHPVNPDVTMTSK